VLGSVALLFAAVPAHAVEPFAAARPLPTLGAGCVARTLTPGSPARAFGDCDRVDENGVNQHDRLAYFELGPDGWHGRVLSVLGRPVASAQDTTGTYLLFEMHDPARGQGAGVLRRDRAGGYTWRSLNSPGPVGGAGIVVRNGRWWAVWSCVRTAGREYSLCESGTLLGATATRQITADAAGDALPSLALRGDGTVGLMWTRVRQTTDGGDYEIRFATSTGHGWASRQMATASNYNLFGQLSTDGRHWLATWTQRSRPVVASDESGNWRTHEFVSRSCAYSTRIAVSAATVMVAVNQCSPDDPSGSAVVALERRDGRWTTATVSNHPGGQGPVASDLTSVSGRATVLLQQPPSFGSVTRSQ
jgi:hypothetical protein